MGLITQAARWRKGWLTMRKKNVLVVDDDPAILETLRAALEDHGYRVLTAVDGEALDAARQEQPDLILLNLIMLGEDGVQLSERLHGTQETADIPIIVMPLALTNHRP